VKQRLVTVGTAALGCALALSVGACGGTDDTGRQPLAVGLLVALTGPYKSIGNDLRDGFRLYLSAHGGKLGGHPVELHAADEGDGADTALPAATKLVKDDNVIAMTGVVGAGSAAAVAPLVTEANIPLVGANGRPELKDDRYIWHTSFRSDEPGAAIAPFVRKKVKGPVYVLGPDYVDGYEEARGFTDAFTQLGGRVANLGGTPQFTPFPGTVDFTPFLNQVKQTGAKGVYAAYAGQTAVDFVKSYARSSAAGLPLFGPGSLTEGPALAAEGAAAQNVSTVLNYATDLDNPANRRFVGAWLAAHPGTPVTTYAMAAWDAALVLDRAIAAAGQDGATITAERINRAIGGLGQIDSPRGPWQFDQKSHSPIQPWYLRQVRRDGRGLSNVVLQDL
jgi:branched-chain amino acid transport system substrate-binding protein